MTSPSLQGVALGASLIEHVHDGEIADRVLGSKHSNVLVQVTGGQRRQRLLHARNGAAEHGLHRVAGQRVFNGDDKVNVLQVLFQPALDAHVQFVHVLEHNRAFGFGIESEDSVSAKFLHTGAEPAAGLDGKHVAMKGFAGQRARNRAV